MSEAILGISAYYHDSAAALVIDGEIVAAAHEERFTRRKHDASFPANAASYCLAEAGLAFKELTAVAFYDKPFLKFERLLETYHGFAPSGLTSFLSAMPVWIKEKLFMGKMLKDEFAKLGPGKPQVLFPEHHLSHAASAFYPSPFEEAAILTIDGVGEWATTAIGHGKGKDITFLRELDFPHSLGLLYSAFTYYCGFKVNSGEYKLMGLAPYGNPGARRVADFKAKILDQLIDLRPDGSMLLNMDYFGYATGLRMCREDAWERLFGLPKRASETELTQDYMDMALAIQQVTEDVVMRLARTARELTGAKNLTMAGGVSLNCVANGKLIREGVFEGVWIQPAAGDAGGALGAALSAHHIWKGHERTPHKRDAMRGAYLGPEFSAADVKRLAARRHAPYKHFDDFDALAREVSGLLAQGNVVGWFQGRMEYGPRALGNRSILGDPRNPEMQKKLNLKIKYREGFRPFAPSVQEEAIGDYFDIDRPSPYMLLVAPVRPERQNPLPEGYDDMGMWERLYVLRSDLPAITHVDYSARIQSVSRDVNERYWRLIDAFRQTQGCAVVVNTSFNVRGEPIVCTPADAYRCFMRTEMDYLVLGDFLFAKPDQPPLPDDEDWMAQYELD
ncbi:Decarbamoylnovobiocin carbamoyltransferase [Fundidesulfovibrio magnetotacticus]|uniref:Decarbamoylnovobiocin carbamoyltransferase n=1 Tax=Fundidesulfovibrio magnetotacticus TaxID=2730080 RepID=A0A6V8LYN1_9BACT|nr:carbamoyltransferase [Fundidesulfovibrio magnetotacticus]GFK93375.1 Decarbamoylnovobiocin carbamoyltransferase [Fundidesulfovibrio magnetotacticus]